MFIGHFAVGLASKRAAPRTSLGTLVMAALFLDLLWPVFLLLGIERVRIDPGNTAFTPLDFEHYPWTHSLLMSLVWGAIVGLIYRWRTGYARGAVWVGIAVVSHWVLDFVTHRPDLPLAPGVDTRVGLGMWNAPNITLIVEAEMFAAGAWLYHAITKPYGRVGSIALWSYVLVLILVYVWNAVSPPPPDVRTLAWVALAMWLFVAWAYGIDRSREATA